MDTAEIVTGKLARWGRRKIHHTDAIRVYIFVMTKQAKATQEQGKSRRCRWCRHQLPVRSGPGRPAEFCSQRCRQWDWVSRQRAADLELSENELVMARDELDELKDQIYVLHCAVMDAKADLAKGRHSAQSLRDILDWVMEAAEPVAAASLSPSLRP